MSFEWYESRDILWGTLIALIFLTIWWIWGREKIGMPMMNTLMKKKSAPSWIMLFLWTIRGLIFLLIGCAFLHPNLTQERLIPEPTDDRSIVLLDISRSMLADDIRPDRITKAKELIETLLSRKSTRSIGYIVFAGKSFVLTPPTTDRESLRNLVQNTSPETIDQSLKDTSGTNI